MTYPSSWRSEIVELPKGPVSTSSATLIAAVRPAPRRARRRNSPRHVSAAVRLIDAVTLSKYAIASLREPAHDRLISQFRRSRARRALDALCGIPREIPCPPANRRPRTPAWIREGGRSEVPRFRSFRDRTPKLYSFMGIG
ncbi:hypothetical protein EVAR_29357_1 [Eumeta japonica]|uniref:Uncharacterized protein n=1 Tax=Eumeta variegata TaxID=151549 RepID=A0A4C1WGT6_EUMVA|nr:hypothetical protein EVAR_29357_1 [Eumeta japonica]